jgi:hypothetical protein
MSGFGQGNIANPYGGGSTGKLIRDGKRDSESSLLGSGLERSFYSEKDDPNSSKYLFPEVAANRSNYLLIFGALAGILLLIAGILSWILFARNKTSFLLTVAIGITLLMLVAFAIAGLSIPVKKACKEGTNENTIFTGFIYIGAIVAAVLLLATALMILLYRYYHINWVIYNKDNGAWEGKYFKEWSAQEGWNSDKRLLNWTAFLCTLAAILFGVIFLTMWSVTKNTLKMTRGCLAICGMFGVAFALLAIWRADAVHQRNSLHTAFQEEGLQSQWRSYYWLLFFFIVLLVINLIFNVIKKRIIYFILAMVLLIFIIIFAINAAIHLRKLKQQVAPGGTLNVNSRDNLANIHEGDIEGWCQKYLPEGTQCSKDFEANRWESDDKRMTLDPGCAKVSSNYITWPMFMAGWYTIIALLFGIAVVACDIYLSDTSEFLETYNRVIGILEIIGLLVALLLILLVFILFVTHTDPSPYRENPNTAALKQIRQGKDVELDGFTKVPSSVVEEANSAGNVCIPYSTTLNTSVKKNAACAGSRCGYRVFILGENLEFTGANLNSPSVMEADSRSLSYPTAKNSKDFYLGLFGTHTEIQEALSAIKFCPTIFNEKSHVYFNVQEVDLDKLNNKGLKSGESVSPVTLSPTGSRGIPAYPKDVAACDSNCQNFNSIITSSGNAQVVGTLYVKNDKNVYEVINNTSSSKLTASFVHGDNVYNKAEVGDISNGVINFLVPNSSTRSYSGVLKFVDTAGHYLPFSKDIIIPLSATGTVNIGNLELITKDGNGCQGSADVATCFSSKSTGRGKIIIEVFDGDTNKPLEGATVDLKASHVHSSRTLSTKTTDAKGKVEFTDMMMDYYLAIGNHPQYSSYSSSVSLSTPESTHVLYLKPKNTAAMQIGMEMDNKVADNDLFLKIKSDTGKECTVSPFNKFCGYSEYLNDVRQGRMGMENIKIHNLAVASYLNYVQSSSAANPTCTKYNTVNNVHYAGLPSIFENTRVLSTEEKHRAFDSAKPFWLVSCFTGFGEASVKGVNEKLAAEPAMSRCEALYPESDKWSIKNLKAKIAAAAKK